MEAVPHQGVVPFIIGPSLNVSLNIFIPARLATMGLLEKAPARQLGQVSLYSSAVRGSFSLNPGQARPLLSNQSPVHLCLVSEPGQQTWSQQSPDARRLWPPPFILLKQIRAEELRRVVTHLFMIFN